MRSVHQVYTQRTQVALIMRRIACMQQMAELPDLTNNQSGMCIMNQREDQVSISAIFMHSAGHVQYGIVSSVVLRGDPIIYVQHLAVDLTISYSAAASDSISVQKNLL